MDTGVIITATVSSGGEIQASMAPSGVVITGTVAAGAPGIGVPAGGTTGQVLVKNSSTSGDAGWASIGGVGLGGDLGGTLTAPQVISTHLSSPLPVLQGGTGLSSLSGLFNLISPLTTKGDLLSYGTSNVRLPVGSDGQVLTADSTQTLGVKWGSAGGAGDMLLAGIQTITGAKTFNAGTLLDKGTVVFDVRAFGAVLDGVTDDSAALQAAHNALPAAGGKIVIIGGTLALAAQITLSKSNVEIEMRSGAGIKAIAGAANISLGTGQPGLIHIYSATGTQNNIWLHGGFIDLNNITELNALSIWGAGTNPAVYTMSGIRISDMTIKNKGNSTFTYGFVSVISGPYGNPTPGLISDLWFDHVTFDTTDKDCVDLHCDYFLDFKFTNCLFQNSQHATIILLGNVDNSNQRLEVSSCRFIHTKLATSSNPFDILDANLHGGYDFVCNNCYFSNVGDTQATGRVAISLEGWKRVKVTNSTFLSLWEAINWAGSQAASGWSYSGNEEVIFAHNLVDSCVNVFDFDATYLTRITDNVFTNCGFDVFAEYSQHYYVHFENNLIYNANSYVQNSTILTLAGVTTATLQEGSKAAMTVGDIDHMVFRGNTIVDDRVLTDPGATACTFSQAAGGSLGARTYYVRVTYSNASGETLGSTEQSFAVSANNLITIKPGNPGSGYHTFSGIRNINIYVSTSPGTETLQSSLSFPSQHNMNNGWTEPNTGLISGAALPGSNTTHALTKYGVYTTDTINRSGPNLYENNRFYGISTPFGFAAKSRADTSLIKDNVLNDVRLPDSGGYHLGAGSSLVMDLAAPPQPTATPSGSGGTLPADTYYYVVTGVGPLGGETIASIEQTATTTGSTSSVALSWTAVAGAASYNVYRSNGVDGSHRQAVYYNTATNSYTDTNASSSAGSPPAVGTAYVLNITGAGAIGTIGPLTITSTNSQALAVGPHGATNPAFSVDGSQANEANGIKITGVVAGSAARLSVTSSASNDNLWIDAKGSGLIVIGGQSTGGTAFGSAVRISTGNSNALQITDASNNNKIFQVDTSAGSVATGLKLTGAAAGSGAALSTLSSGSNENLTLDAKGTGTLTLNGTATGAVILGQIANFKAATTGAASLNIPSGVAPTSPNSGDVWFDGSHIQFRNGSTTDQLDNQGGMANPMTTLGDLIYENATPAPARLAGSTSATKQFLTQTGTGSVSAAPAWGTIAAGDVPTLNQNTTGSAGSANALNSATTTVNVSSAAAPTSGQVLTATGGSAATWQTPAGGSGVSKGFVIAMATALG